MAVLFIQPGRFAAGSFDPTTVAGLLIWLDASDTSTFTFSSGTIISRWNDKSGNARDLTVASGGAINRSGTQNGLDTVVSTTTSGRLTGPSASATTAITYAYVSKRTGSFNASWFRYGNVSVGQQATNSRFTANTVADVDSGVAAAAAYSVYVWTVSGTARTLHVDGTLAYSGAGLAINTGGSAAVFNIDNGVANVELAELMLYNSALGTTDRQYLETGLKAKWGTP